MKSRMSFAAILTLVMAFALPMVAWAAPQSGGASGQAPQPVGSLQVNGGVITLSQNGAVFVTGNTNDPVFDNERMMVVANSSATINCSDGSSATYTKPGVYLIGCSKGYPVALFVAGAIVTAGAIYQSTIDSHSYPVSH